MRQMLNTLKENNACYFMQGVLDTFYRESLQNHSLLLALCSSFNLLLDLGFDFLLVDLSRRFASFTLGDFTALDTHSSRSTPPNLFFSVFPSGCTVTDLVSEGLISVIILIP